MKTKDTLYLNKLAEFPKKDCFYSKIQYKADEIDAEFKMSRKDKWIFRNSL